MNVQAFFETLATIIGERYDVKIKVEVKENGIISAPKKRTDRNSSV